MRAYLTLLGRSTWATVNAYYAVLEHKRYYPDEVYIILEKIHLDKLKKTIEALNLISQSYGLHPVISYKVVKENDPLDVKAVFEEILENLKVKGAKIAIEITSARKALAVPAVIYGIKYSVDHIFYLALRSLEHADRPYYMIPLQNQLLRDFREEFKWNS